MIDLRQSGLLAGFRARGGILKSPRLHLKLFDESQITPRYVEWFNDPVVCRFNRHGSGYTPEKALQYARKIQQSPVTVVFSLWTSLRPVHIGNISLNDID